MWLGKPSRDGKAGRARLSLGAALAVAVALGMAGCSADYVESNKASVLLVINAINGGAQLDSDVVNGDESVSNPTLFVCENEVDVKVTALNKNPLGPTVASSTVQLQSYEVRYTRTDGRGVEGVDVPFRITGVLATNVGVGDEVTFPLEVVRRQAKQEPPLQNISQTTVLTVLAQVTLYGKTISGESVSATGGLQIDFADFGDKETACPAN
jgi:hypothetical protein